MKRHLVKNSSRLAKSKLRRDALAILEAGFRAIDTGEAVRRNVKLRGRHLRVGKKTYDLSRFNRLFVVGFGKASLAAAAELEKILGRRIAGGIVLDTRASRLKYVKTIAGTHPFPSNRNVRATGEVTKLLEKADSRDLILTVVSGGGSALLCRPYGVTCGELVLVTKALMRRGADIREMNIVRKHLSEILGGQFARLAYPATVAALIFSDVPGDDLCFVASGPTCLDTTTAEDAAAVLAKYDVIKNCGLHSCGLRETPKDRTFFRKVTNTIAVGNSVATAAMKQAAAKLGYKARILTDVLAGEARDVGRMLAVLPKPGEAVIAAGETTVTVTGKGRGGRNQEVALGALEYVGSDGLVLSANSDGIDNATPAAGAFADSLVCAAVRRRRLVPSKFLADNDSYRFGKAAGSLIVTGPTGANVSDLMLAMRAKRMP